MLPRHPQLASLPWRTPPACESGRTLQRRRGFTLTELLVVVAIILVLMSLLSAAVSAARNSAKRSATEMAITKLNQIVSAQFDRYASRSVLPSQLPAEIPNKSAARAWFIRRNMITADMVDRWTDVELMASGSAVAYTFPKDVNGTIETGTAFFPLSSVQASYVATWKQADPKPSPQYAGAECLFMTVMQGGFADCLDCESLRTLKKGDKDGDGMFEFWDGWDEPIGYILWPAAYEKKGGGRYFVDANALDPNPFASNGTIRPTLGMRPLIYSAGPDKEYGLERSGEASTLDVGASPLGRDCGNHLVEPTSRAGGPVAQAGNNQADNITNLDLGAAQ